MLEELILDVAMFISDQWKGIVLGFVIGILLI